MAVGGWIRVVLQARSGILPRAQPRQGCEAHSFIDLLALCISRGELAVNNVDSWDAEVKLRRCTLLAGKRC